jgi:hypothetical protein
MENVCGLFAGGFDDAVRLALCVGDNLLRLLLTFSNTFLTEAIDQLLDARCRWLFIHAVFLC